ncbi:MAG TPA: FeoA family protein [Terriglobia bacterium]|nr:FeoA family protein [Terriglobia bacterium]
MQFENENRFHIESDRKRRLTQAPLDAWVRIERLDGPMDDCRRLADLGFTPGEEISVIHTAPFGDPLVVRVRGAQLALRKREASWIWIE